MAGILQNVFSKGIISLKEHDHITKLRKMANHSTLYFGLVVYTAAGAWVDFTQEASVIY